MEARGALRLSLGTLDDEAVAELVETLIGARPGDRLLGQVARAGGNPFFTTELVASLQRAGAITLVNDVAEVAVNALTPTLTNTILQRLSFLSEEALETLQVASILGSSFSVADLASAVGTRAPTLAPILSAAVRAGILGDDYPLLSFRHDLIREALYQSVQPALRAWWHLAAAQVLADGRSHEELAEHVIRGASPGDLGAVEWLRTAAQQAAGRSPVAAAILLQRALDLAPATTPHRDQARADLAFYLLRSGRLVEAETICRDLLAAPRDVAVAAPYPDVTAAPGIDEGRLRTILVEATVGQGRINQALSDLEEAVDAPGLSDADRARLWAWASQCRVITWDLRGAADAARLALIAAARAHDDVSTSIALGNLAVVHHLRGEFAEALRLAQEALERVAVGVGSPTNPFHSVLNLVATLMDLDRLQDAQVTLGYWQRFRREPGAGCNHPILQIVGAIGHFWSGEWDHAIASLQSGLDLAETTGIRLGTLVGHSLRCLIALHRGDLALAGREAAAGEAAAAIAGPQWRPDWTMWARALLLEAGGRGAEALRVLTKAWGLCADAGVLAEFPVIGPDLVRLALAAGEPLKAEEVTAAVEALAATAGIASITGAALRCRAAVSGDTATALAAVAAYRTSPRRRELAQACEDAAAALTAAGRTGEAQPLAAEALTLYRGLAAHQDVARAQTRLRLALQRAPAPRERTLRGASWDSLTPAELAVATLVAAGLNNPQIAERLGVSPRTVQSHVSKILTKLGLTSRVEIAVQARGSPPPGQRRG
ncbi:MAG: LuxR family transcriptional regulator [Actinomycetota bacterium]